MRCSARRPNPPGSEKSEASDELLLSLHVWRVRAPLKLRGGGEGRGGGTRGAERATPRIPLGNLVSAAGAKRAPRGDQPLPHPADPPIWVSHSPETQQRGSRGQSPRCATDSGTEVGAKKSAVRRGGRTHQDLPGRIIRVSFFSPFMSGE